MSKKFFIISLILFGLILQGFSFRDAQYIENVALMGIENTVYAGTPCHRGQIQITIKEFIAQDISVEEIGT